MLRIPGKVYNETLIESVKKIMKNKIIREQDGVRTGRVVSQTFSMTTILNKMLAQELKTICC